MAILDVTEKAIEDLQSQIDTLVSELDNNAADTDEFAKILERIERLHKIRLAYIERSLEAVETHRKVALDAKPESRRVSPDTIALIGANLVGLLLVMNYERMHVIASKAFGLLVRTKI